MKQHLYLTAFVGGMCTLAIELTISRLLGFFFGFSDLVYSFVISMILAYLALGYFIGGRWADRSPETTTFYKIIAWAAATIALIPITARPLLRNAAIGIATINIPRIFLWGLPVLLIIAVPLILLACVSPFLIRLLLDDRAKAGQISGRVYAISTVGSLLGAFGPSLFFIPLIGALRTFHIFAVSLSILAISGLYLNHRSTALRYAWNPALILIVVALTASNLGKAPPPGARLLYETESAYNYIQVAEYPDQTRVLILNEGLAVHSIYNPNFPATFTGGAWDYALVGPYFNRPPYSPENIRKIVVIGLAAGTIPRQYTFLYGEDVQIDGIEIDPRIVDVGQEYFGMNQPNLNVIIADGRVGLRALGGGYQLVQIDAYKVPYVPWQLTTVEFFSEVQTHLAPDGVVSVNVGRSPTNREMIEAIARSLMEVFPTVHVVDIPNTFNAFIYATNAPTLSRNLLTNGTYLQNQVDPVIPNTLYNAYLNLQPTVGSEILLTDDRAPIEFIVHKLALEYALFGDLDSLREEFGTDK